MAWLRVALLRSRGLFGRKQLDTELDSELRTHIDALIDENVRRGMTLENARHAAQRDFGGFAQTKESYGDQRGFRFVEVPGQDLRFALRMLAKKPGFAVVAILTLALGMGATTAVFSVVDRILFRSLPYPHDDRLISFGFVAPIEQNEFMLGTDYLPWRAQQTPFEAVAAMKPGVSDCDLTEQNPARLSCASIEATFLPTFGVRPLLGRNFTRDEDQAKAPGVALLSYGLWRARYGGALDIAGKTVSLDGKPTRIVGVLPAEFELPSLARADILVPLALDEAQQQRPRTGAVLRAFARLRPGVSPVQAAAALQPLFQESLRFVPSQFRKEVSLQVRSLRDRQVQDARLVSWLLLAAVFAVLLLACTNVASLLLARAMGRQRELAVRAALGASSARLACQALTESLLLGLLGGAAGCGVAHGLLRLFLSIAPEGVPRLQQAGLDARVAMFTLAVSLVSGVLFGLAPALHSPAPELLCGKEVNGTSRSLSRPTLVAAQFAISAALLAGAGLLLRSLWNLQSVPTGMETEHLIVETAVLGESRYPQNPQQFAFFNELEARLKRLPGIASLALSDSLPPAGQSRSTIFAGIEIAGRPRFAEGTGGMVGWRAVTPQYFSVLGIPILHGRAFTEEDRVPAENPIILSDSLARQLFPDEKPIGRQMRFARQGPWRTVVGIAANVKNNGLAMQPGPEFYIPWKNEAIQSGDAGHVIVKSMVRPKVMAAWMREETAGLDATLPVTIEAMAQRVSKLAERPRFNAVLLSLFAGMGVLLAAMGMYGVVAFLVAQQTREIGVRMALGASPHSILKLVLSTIARWTIGGAVLGICGAWATACFLQSLLFEVRARDPLLLGLAFCVLLIVALAAAWIPARRAMRADPMTALRYQ